MAQISTQQKVQTCLEFIDEQLDNQSEQTIKIAELIIDDIKELTQAYPAALRSGELKQHMERVRNTQMNWVNQLQDIIQEQNNRDLNNEVLHALQNFMNTLNHQTLAQSKLQLPPAMESRVNHPNDYLEPNEIDLLLGQQSLFDSVRH